jgi:DNA-directed RNA polymerase subunit alpha
LKGKTMLQPTFLIESIEEKDNYAKLSIEPLEKGYGQTVGVSLRRVLLNSIEGAAVTRVNIEGVQHQFSSLEGMKEDVVDLVLNLKKLRFWTESEEPVVIKLEAKGVGDVTGNDLKLPANIKLANPDQVLATLSAKSAAINAEITIQKGRGYILASDMERGNIGDINIDASFSPIIKVAYKVEATRVGRQTDFDKLIMDVWTDGTIEPRPSY